MAETPNERTHEVGDLAAAARDRGIETLEGAKGQLAEGAERVAAAVERTADELEGGGDDTISGFGRSAASLMRQLAGGLRERDVEAFARELGALARRNPAIFLAGSVALGFGIARFFKARVPHSGSAGDYGWQSTGGRQGSSESDLGEPNGRYSEENLDLSAAATSSEEGAGERSRTAQSEIASPSGGTSQSGSSYGTDPTQSSSATQQSPAGDEDPNQAKSRQSAKQKTKPQRASSGGAQRAGEPSSPPSTEGPSTDPASGGERPGSADSAFTGGTGGGTLRGGKS